MTTLNSVEKTRVLIADSQSIIRKGIRSFLEEAGGYSVVGEAKDQQDVIRWVKELGGRKGIDAAVVGLNFPFETGPGVLRWFAEEHPGMPILTIGGIEHDCIRDHALKMGASGYVSKDCTGERLLRAIGAVVSGRIYARWSTGNNSELTVREVHVLHEIAMGKEEADIATAFNIAESTVTNHKAHIRDKLGCRNDADLTRYAILTGIISL